MCLRSRTALTAELRRMPLMSRRRCRRRCRRMFFVDRDPLRPHLAIGETHTICGLRTRKHNLRDTELHCSVTPRDSGTGTDKVDIGDPAPAFDEVRPVPNGRTNPRDAVSRLRDFATSQLRDFATGRESQRRRFPDNLATIQRVEYRDARVLARRSRRPHGDRRTARARPAQRSRTADLKPLTSGNSLRPVDFARLSSAEWATSMGSVYW